MRVSPKVLATSVLALAMAGCVTDSATGSMASAASYYSSLVDYTVKSTNAAGYYAVPRALWRNSGNSDAARVNAMLAKGLSGPRQPNVQALVPAGEVWIIPVCNDKPQPAKKKMATVSEGGQSSVSCK